ncbi:MAG TPA: hypothetical protein PK250_12915 [Syntrophobacter fumaroxidans]|nr:hypothetical protein [Syntrophobacter fumaroxidans]
MSSQVYWVSFGLGAAFGTALAFLLPGFFQALAERRGRRLDIEAAMRKEG